VLVDREEHKAGRQPEVCRGEDADDSGGDAGRLDVGDVDRGMSHRAADEDGVQQVVDDDVVDVVSATADEVRVLDAGDGVAEKRSSHQATL